MFTDMFKHSGKYMELIKDKNLKLYQDMYLMLRKMQSEGELPVHPEDNYIGKNELAKNIYEKKYYLKDLKNRLIEKRPEDIFTRQAAFISATAAQQVAPLWVVLYYIKYSAHVCIKEWIAGYSP